MCSNEKVVLSQLSQASPGAPYIPTAKAGGFTARFGKSRALLTFLVNIPAFVEFYFYFNFF
jgi:hypothetical protein